ncbi:MAG: hypothetical protein HYT80_07225 [Euryarchaeota archaeon]|nr:hypothetical protein [Euryarchaeota archaeon]
MAETSNAETLSVKGALDTLRKLEGLEIGLYQRTEGATFMLWGLVNAGIFFTFTAFGAIFEENFPTWASFAWAPWVAAGMLATWALWRSAHVTAQMPASRGHGAREMVFYLTLYSVLFVSGFTLYAMSGGLGDLKEPGIATIVLGLCSAGAAVLRRNRSTPAAQRIGIGVGILAIALTLVLSFAVSYSVDWQAYWYQSIAGVVTIGGGWFAGGFYLTMKG